MRVSVTRLQHVEILNLLGQALSHFAAEKASYHDVVERLRQILGMPSISLWLVGARRPMLGREVCSFEADVPPDAEWLDFDEELAFWQKDNIRPLVIRSPAELPAHLSHHRLPCKELVSLPILYRETSLQGVLNFYSHSDNLLLIPAADEETQLALFRGIAGQVSIFAENRTLEASSLLLREIHHRVKNNLQIVTSLLRMQIRRLSHVTPEQALQDSINRIHSIAVVHERLSRTDLGRVDFADLVRQLADSLTSTLSAGVKVRLQTRGDPVMLDSGDATSAALVANELLQNAIQHGSADDGEVEIGVYSTEDRVRFEVQDHGPGLPPGFDVEKDSHLGLTIVSTLVNAELRGEFGLHSGDGTKAWVSFPTEPATARKGAKS